MNKDLSQKLNAIIFLGIILIPVVGLMGDSGDQSRVPVQKTVWASLYTWYGVPGDAAGKYFYPEWQKNASNPADSGWNYSLSTMTNVVKTPDPHIFNITGTALESGQSLVLSIDVNRFAYDRMYIELNLSVQNIENAQLEMILYRQFKSGDSIINGKTNATITQKVQSSADYSIVNQILFVSLNTTTTDYYPGRMLVLNLTAINPGDFSLGVNYMEGSSWFHYNEDYHTYPDEFGFWFNDPPIHLATAHHAYYDGLKWPEIPSYGAYNHSKWDEYPDDDDILYGIYDSLNRTVIKAQLLLMEKAGIDVCQIMHPWSLDVPKLIFEIANEINSNLTFSYYIGRTINELADVLVTFKDEPRFYRIDGKPVITWGYTGGLEEPFQSVYQKVIEVRKAWDVYLVGDLYSSRFITKEEMLQIYDCWYYYDTSALLRHGYADHIIENYQPDGTLWPLNNWGNLDHLFGSISALSHAHGKQFCAIVIPGTDNTCVHDFNTPNNPMYDGRTGTINSRSDGYTFNYTWQGAIKSGADFVNIVSWNELHEGTEIEPTLENGTFYVELNKFWVNYYKNN